MKKLSILLLALAIAAFAVPAMAGDVSMSGEYTFGGESWDVDGGTPDEKYGLFYDELDLDIEISMDDVLFHWDVEVVDDGTFDRGDGAGNPGVDSETDGTWANIVDTMWVKWQVNDALATKIGDYGIGWANDLVVDDVGGGTGTVGVMYALEMVDVAVYLSRDSEGSYGDTTSQDDDTTMGVTVEGEIGPAEVGVIYLTTTNDISAADDDHSLIGVYANFAAGPVGVTLEYGQDSADLDSADGGTALLAEFDLGELVGFGLSVAVVQTSEEWYNLYGNDFDRVTIIDHEGDSDDLDAMAVFVNAEYGVDDALTVGADAMVMSDIDGDSAGTEVDVWASYGFADNVSGEVGYATTSEGDVGMKATKSWFELVLEM